MWRERIVTGHQLLAWEGTALILALVDWARDAAAPALDLWVADDNDAARLLYERCGVTATGERDVIRDGLGEQRMRLPLD